MKILLAFLLVFILLIPLGCDSAPDEVDEADPGEEVEPGNGEANGDAPAMARVATAPQLDGSGEGFTAEPLLVAGTEIYLAHDGDLLYVHMEADVEGWISVGFNSQGGGMNGANMILGYLDNGSPAYRDDVGQGNRHSEISSPAVVDFHFSVDNGTTTMAFSYPLVFPDDEGFNLEGLTPGENYTMIVAVNNSSYNISSAHSTRGSTDFMAE